MDPNAAWKEMAAAVENDDWEIADELAEGLLGWLERGGFPPSITGQDEFDRIAAKAACREVRLHATY
jgi:hypothetical protein